MSNLFNILTPSHEQPTNAQTHPASPDHAPTSPLGDMNCSAGTEESQGTVYPDPKEFTFQAKIIQWNLDTVQAIQSSGALKISKLWKIDEPDYFEKSLDLASVGETWNGKDAECDAANGAIVEKRVDLQWGPYVGKPRCYRVC